MDGAGNAYVTGSTSSTNFPTTTGAFQTSLSSGNSQDIFVAKLNSAGTALGYSTYLHGNDPDAFDSGLAIAVDGSGIAYVTGYTYSTSFPTTTGAFQPSHSTADGLSHAFVTKLNAAGTALIYSTYLSGSGSDQAYAIAVDGSGNAYVTGSTASINFPTTAGAYQTTFGGGGEAFVTKLNAIGTALVYSTYLGGDAGRGIAVDAAGNAYVTGNTSSSAFPTTTDAYQTTFNGILDAYLTKLNAAGAALVYSTYFGGTGVDVAYGIALGDAGNAYITGSTSSSNFPTTPGSEQTSYGGGGDAFVAEFTFPALPTADPSKSTISIAPATIQPGGTATVTLTTRDASGNLLTSGGLPFNFGLGTGTGSGTFSNLTDNQNGTYTATFTGTTAGTIIITGTINGQAITSSLPTVTISPAASKLVISNLSSTSVTAGGTVTFTVTAEDGSNNPVPGYLGTVTLTSTDNNASYNGASLPANYTFVGTDNGSHSFTVTLRSAGSKTITLTDQANASVTATTNPIAVAAAATNHFALAVASQTYTPGTPFNVTVTAEDAYNNPTGTAYTGTVHFSAAPSAGASFTPNDVPLTNGTGVISASLTAGGTVTITAADAATAGINGALSVNPGSSPTGAAFFTVAPVIAGAQTTGTSFAITVTTKDQNNATFPGYTGTISITSTDPAAPVLVSSYHFLAGDNGVHTFTVTLNTSTLSSGIGTMIIVRDVNATTPPINGFSAPITVQGLVVLGAPQKTATGFTVTFSKPFTPADLTMYGSNTTTVQDVSLVGGPH